MRARRPSYGPGRDASVVIEPGATRASDSAAVSSADADGDGGATVPVDVLSPGSRPPRGRNDQGVRSRRTFRTPPAPLGDPDEPIVSELFSVDRLEQHAESLAAAEGVTAEPGRGHPILPRLADNGRYLLDAYRKLAVSIREERSITPAAEWLVDNFHIVEEQLREIRDDLPDTYYRELPKLAEGPLGGYPRVLGLAWAYVAHTDSRFDAESLRRTVVAYQHVAPLTIGELWAIAISLRIVLVENLRHAAERIIRARAARLLADTMADSLLGLGPAGAPRGDPSAALRRSDTKLPVAARVQLFQRLRDQDPASTPALGWLEQRLAAEGTTAEEMVRREHQRQAELNVTVRNVVTSMRMLSWFDWATFVEGTSLVDEALRSGSAFEQMDFSTRDRYRHAVEDLARRSRRSEVEVAGAAVEAASAAAKEPDPGPESDPGYYLIAEGRRAFAQSLGASEPARARLRRAFGSSIQPYVASVALVTALLMLPPLAAGLGAAAGALAVLVALLALGPASDLAVALVNRFVTGRVRPSPLARLELRDGIPGDLRTLVAVPTLLVSEADAEEQVRRLEINYLGNPDGDVRFALISDWLDSPTEGRDGDDEVLSAAAAAIEGLNRRHGDAPGGGPRFLLLHRRRRWNASEGRWMGWERKRGKLHELNALLRGSTTTDFLTSGGAYAQPPQTVRYVVTLDADTRLPREALNRLVGTAAHPLNRPRFGTRAGRVTRGYGILQPRVTQTLPAEHEASLFQRVFSGPAGIDPYASAVSDLYQDLFGEGSYTGKGIYDVDAFEAALVGRVPENTLLSHDLFEGTFARAGLVTDVELFDEFPSNYLESASRDHRWARGDWQLLPWILGRVRDVSGTPASRSLPGVARWKMIDNLRRTLSEPLTLATLLVAWLLPTVQAVSWTMLVLAAMVLPAALPVAAGLLPRRQGISRRSHFRAVGSDLAIAVTQVGLAIALLPHRAALMADAIGRTLVRLLITKRNLLEWTTASQTKGSVALDIRAFYRRMGGGIAFAALAASVVVVVQSSALPLALPFTALWLLSPAIARWVSTPPSAAEAPELSHADVQSLRLLARRTWRFFEDHVGPEDHALPPDNFQEDPDPVVAHRTSPTNIGMYLLSIIAARDFGWIGTIDAVERLEATLGSVTRLQRHRGHLYNWYDTRDLRALDPPYVSSVDSGNLCAALLVVANACVEMLDQPPPIAAALLGTWDALAITSAAASVGSTGRPTQSVGQRDIAEALAPFRDIPDEPPSLAAWAGLLARLRADTRTLADVALAFTAERGGADDSEFAGWARRAGATVASHARDIEILGVSPADVPEVVATTPTLGELLDAGDDVTHGDGAARAAMVRRITSLGALARRLFAETEFGFLFDPTRKLFSIGYRTSDGTLDPSFYDLLASEARLTSFLAIAKGDVPTEHWFRLGRGMTPVGRGTALISWSGSMFEYLMPALVMDAPAGSLLEQTYELVVARQISYGAQRGVPWGISESALNARDLDQTYQYSSFGVPGLGLKRGLAEDVVIAPYATALAAMVRPAAAADNLRRLAAAGAAGRYGLHEALDYTPTRLRTGATVAVVESYMAHHQGMALVAIGNVLNERPMVRRFHAEPLVQATELLLQERMPRDVLVARPRADEVRSAADVRDLVPPVLRRFTSPHDPTPRTHLLSNGRYAVMVTAAGSGYSRWGDIAVTRWREDTTEDSWGSYLFLRDTASGAVWSAGHQPSGVEADSYEVRYSEPQAEFSRRDGSIVTGMTIVVSAEHDAEIRRVALTNLGAHAREIELTSYAEIVLAPQAADLAHPAFSNLFVQTEFEPGLGALLATRRPRAAGDPDVWAAHVVAVEDRPQGPIQYETDRARFLGRGRSVRSAISITDGRPLSNTVGAVLDPIFSLRCRVSIAAGATAHVMFSTVVADSREAVLDLADKYRDAVAYERASTLAWTQAQVQLRHLGIEGDEAHLFQRLANRVVYADAGLRPGQSVLARNERGPQGLWARGISGDLPIVLVRIDQAQDIEIVRQLLRAHEYWRMKLLDVDLVIVNEHVVSYLEDVQGALEAAVRTSQSTVHEQSESRGRVFVLRGDQLSSEERTLLLAAARAVLLSRGGSLADQVLRLERPPTIVHPAPAVRREGHSSPPRRPDLEFYNGLGGFADGGREYVTILGPGQATPAPWVNVVANPSFGFIASESGSGYTWSENSRENQLTPWANDPVADPPGEAVYVRDEDDGELWTPTALPIRRDESTYVARHGMGYSRFEHERDGIRLDLLQYVPNERSVKVSVLTLENHSGRTRRLSVTAFAAFVLGTDRGSAAPHIVTTHDPATGAIFARNPWNAEFGHRVAFFDLAGRQTAWTADRTEFIGRNGSLDHPEALGRGRVLGRAGGPGVDPCAALQTSLELANGQRAEVVVLLGQAEGPEAARALIEETRAADREATLTQVHRRWDDLVATVQVRTPDRSMDIVLNAWLLYQTLSCRVWARTGLYQAGGAYGFRDQLQDVMALTIARPDIAREHLLRAAAHQFREGDVQHWWHPPSGRGVRTRISDDRLWLAYATARYLEVTGDTSVLDEVAPFIEGPPLAPDQADAYFQPERADAGSTLYEHCARAIDASLVVGVHGLPLIGSGDWNDGMNRVGHEGRGESVWLGWFLYAVIGRLSPVAAARGDRAREARWSAHARALSRALDGSGWDGDWYRRGYFDDGTPLGSAESVECRIDSIAQSWAVISGAGDPDRARRAMAAVDEYLVRAGDGLVLLFTPPFDRSAVDPGYIKGYLPGIRENGGQYTHGAIWSVLAFAGLGDGDRAGELFSILNPINHAATRAGLHRYKVEPYVMAGDVYAEPSHVGRGGWTWYTGSAGWMYRAGVEAILGFQVRGPSLRIDPAIPRAWGRYEIDFRYHSSRYEIVVENPHGVSRGVVSVELDGHLLAVPGADIPLTDDAATHQVRVVLGTVPLELGAP